MLAVSDRSQVPKQLDSFIIIICAQLHVYAMQLNMHDCLT